MAFKIESDTTQLSNAFIDRFMPSAPWAYVVIYIYALRHCMSGNRELSNSEVASALDLLESDVHKAWKYWEKKGLVRLEKNSESIEFLPIKEEKEKKEAIEKKPSIIMEKRPSYSQEEISIYLQKSQTVKQLILSAQEHLGKLLSQNDMSILFSFYDWLGLPIEVIEILLAYCVQNGHSNLRYIEKVAINWADEEIDTPQKALEYIKVRSNGYKEIKKAFGQSARNLLPAEEQYIKKWLTVYKMPIEVLKKACEKTILQTGQASFQYADTIVENWYKSNVKCIEDVERLEEEFAAAKRGKAEQKKKEQLQQTKQGYQPVVKKNRFVNYEQRQWDFEELERMERERIIRKLNEK